MASARIRKTPLVLTVTLFTNLTSGMKLGTPKGRKHVNPDVQISDVNEDSLAIEAPARCAGQGHQVQLGAILINGKEQIPFETTAKVKQIDPLEDDRVQIQLELLQFDADSWNKILGAFADRQKAVLQLLNAMKGDEEDYGFASENEEEA